MHPAGTGGGRGYEPVIGLEVHAQLASSSKMFCGCAARGGAPPNSRTCPTCLGLPGALPVVNARCVDLGVLVALALGCTVAERSVFARKHYFYPDLPKGYQITQFDAPLARDGAVSWVSDGRRRTVRVTRVHLEEDAGKSFHAGFPDSASSAYVDFNRSGVPLVEVVTGPDLSDPADAAEFVRRLRAVLVAIGASEAIMEDGGLRCDANVSLRRAGGRAPGARTEIKNLNSFRALQRALEYEIARQTAALDAGGAIQPDTLGWDEGSGRTVPMRAKEQSDDYRYFPEPDLPPLVVAAGRIERLRASLPELPEQRRERLAARYGLGADDAAALAATPRTAAYFEAAAAACGDAAAACAWMRGELARRLSEAGSTLDEAAVAPDALGRLIRMAAEGAVSASAAKTILGRMVETGREPEEIAAADALLQVSDAGAIDALVAATLARFPEQVRQYRQGKRVIAGFLVGQVMQASGGRANPALADRLVRARLDRADQ